MKIHLVYLIALLFGAQCFAQHWENELYFRNISTNEGLSNPSINCINEDSRGFIWIGTHEGINRYDGNEIKIYSQNIADSNAIQGNKIYSFYEDSLFNLWIGTNEGLSQFNYKTNRFKNYKTGDGPGLVMDISYDKKNNRIWLASWSEGLKYLDLETNLIRTFTNELLGGALAISLLIVNDELFIGTSNSGVYNLNLDSYLVEEFCNTKTGRFQIPSNDINDLHFYKNNLLIGTDGGGLIIHQFEDNKQIYRNPHNASFPSALVSSFAHDLEGFLYIGTNEGLCVYNDRWQLVSFLQKEDGNTTALSSNEINTLYVDKKGDLWIGLSNEGIDLQGNESKNMTLVKKKFTTKNSLSGNNISGFAQDKNGGMWIGTRKDGLNYYRDGLYTHFIADGSENSISGNTITDISIDKHGVVWVSTLDNGLNAFQNGEFILFMHDEANSYSIASNRVRQLEIDKNENLWVATSHGLESFDIEKRKFIHHFLDSDSNELSTMYNINALLSASDGNLYIGTSTGFYVYDPISGKADKYQENANDINSLGNNIVIDIFEDAQKNLWLGTLGWGLILFDRESKTFKSYNHSNGFPDNMVKSIEEDAEGNLWIGTSNGIVKFSPSTEQSLTFGKSYGLQGDLFNRRASLKCDDGRLIFGGTKGFNVFNPEELELGKIPLTILITDLTLYGQSVPISGDPDILNQDISLVNDLQISYKDSKHISFSFSALQFSDPDQVQYAYMLEGFDEKWNYIKNEHKVSFTNLEPNNYTLKVMASDNGLWISPVKELGIRIPSPWYMTIWFRIGLVLSIIVLIVAFYFYKVHAHKERQQILERLVNEKNKEILTQNEELLAIHDELMNVNSTLENRVAQRTLELKESNIKLNKTVMDLDRFVYSASHDLSAPLKSVLGLVHIAKLESKEKTLEVHLNYIEQSIKKQEKVIRSLIQYSRNSRLALKIHPINLFDLVDQVISELKYMPGSDAVNMINEVPMNVSINSDEQRIQTILNNLLSNGINYRSKDKKDSFVQIQFVEQEHAWQLIVKDNGQGVAEEHHKKIFEMFHRANEKSDGSGLGLFIVKEAVDKLGGKISLDSTLSEGSEFVLDFPDV